MTSWTDATIWIQKDELSEEQLTLMLTCEAPKLRALELRGEYTTKEQLMRLAYARWWGQLNELRLWRLIELSSLAKLGSLTGFLCNDCALTPQELEALLLMPWVPTLQWLILEHNWMNEEHILILAHTTPMPRLYKLGLGYNSGLEYHLELLLESNMFNEETKRQLLKARDLIAAI